MLSPTEIAQYHENGYVIPEFRVASGVLYAVKARHAELLQKRPEFRDYCPALLDHDRNFLGYAENLEILDMVQQLIGPDIALWNMSFFAKPASDGKRTPWHQDGEYWPIRPLATCTAWLALDDSTPENGCLRVIRGSHKDRTVKAHNKSADTEVTLTQELDAREYNEAEAADIILEIGRAHV